MNASLIASPKIVRQVGNWDAEKGGDLHIHDGKLMPYARALGLEGFAAYHLQLAAFFELRDAGLDKIEALAGNKPPQLSVMGSIEAAVVIDRGG